MRTVALAVAFPAMLLAAGCGDSPRSPAPPGGPAASASSEPADGHDHGSGADHGAAAPLGTATLAGHAFAVVQVGPVVPGREAAFEVDLASGPPGASLAKLGLFLWVEDAEGQALSAPAKGSMEAGRLHFHVAPRADRGTPKRLVVRLRGDGGADERTGLPLVPEADLPRLGPHDGLVVPFGPAGAAPAGWLELKLHDDKGDLELWLGLDAALQRPFDLPLDAVVAAAFPAAGGRRVELRVRNAAANEGEDGRPNVREGRTNYFIWPGATGADATWLRGAGFSSPVKLSFEAAGARHESAEFLLRPHAAHGDHTHD